MIESGKANGRRINGIPSHLLDHAVLLVAASYNFDLFSRVAEEQAKGDGFEVLARAYGGAGKLAIEMAQAWKIGDSYPPLAK